METERASELLRAERARTEAALDAARAGGSADRDAADEPGDMFDAAEPLVDQGLDDAVVASLQQHLDAIGRAEHRLESGAYGRSVRSGEPIPDDRLEADPAAELTVEEAAADRTATI